MMSCDPDRVMPGDYPAGHAGISLDFRAFHSALPSTRLVLKLKTMDDVQFQLTDGAESPLLSSASLSSLSVELPLAEIGPDISRRLYISHFLSTWNSRIFEFGAILFIAAVFPGTLLPPSLYALVRTASAICLTPAVGKYIDRGNRLEVVRLSISMLPIILCGWKSYYIFVWSKT